MHAAKNYAQNFTTVTLSELDAVWGNADFGPTGKIDVIKSGLLKRASGYHTGHTLKCIMQELGLITEKGNLTARGRHNLYALFSEGLKSL